MTLRTREMQQRYQEYLKTLDRSQCVLCDKEPLEQFRHWKVVTNNFPYDSIAGRHDMIVSLRHALESELYPEELEELRSLKRQLLGGASGYEYVIEPRYRSIPEHFHLHLIVPRAEED